MIHRNLSRRHAWLLGPVVATCRSRGWETRYYGVNVNALFTFLKLWKLPKTGSPVAPGGRNGEFGQQRPVERVFPASPGGAKSLALVYAVPDLD
jgi:hypothetical protein